MKILGSQGPVQCCFKLLDVGVQAAVWAERDDALSQLKNIERRACHRERPTSRVQCLMQIVRCCSSSEVWQRVSTTASLCMLLPSVRANSFTSERALFSRQTPAGTATPSTWTAKPPSILS